uniref:KIB1-4 beta-propeller domain-containing protein n=1 Tax=Setaria italica TaxID=4555 RepID=K4AJI1_SETIT
MSFSSTCKSLESGVEDDLKICKFGLHDISNALSFCCLNEGLQRRIWLGGKGDWLVTTNTSLYMELLNPITRTKVPLPSFGNNLSGIELPSYRELSVIFPPFACDVRRVVLSRTPSHADGNEAIALFSDGLLTYTARGENIWRLLKNPIDHDDNAYNYYPEVFLDVIVYHGWVIACEEDGPVIIPWAKLPLFVTSTDLKGNSVYVADVGNYDVGICSLGKEGQVSITNQDFPFDEKAHLLKGWTICTPMWFRPTAHAKGNN